ncbi:OmpA family protein [Spirillospora sp. NPDC047279]|uniref:OmpA family protein n=1 Tax=Spirillospora sp. NPDC047279 TaxID=3155478 RepID=UPI0033DF7BE7
MRRPIAGAAAFLLVLALPGVAGADPVVPETELQRSVRDLRTAAATLDVRAADAVHDIRVTESVQPLEVEQSDGAKVTVRISSDVLFDFGEATLTAAAKRRIAQLAPRLRQATGTVQVSGHSDAIGAPGYNLTLSRQRAEAVKAELTRLLSGTNARIAATGFGETRPVAPNKVGDRDDPDGRAKNRRVDITFQKS